MDDLFKLLMQNARFTNEQLAVMLGISEKEVAEQIEQYERSGMIRGYKPVVDWEKIDTERVVARIELNVLPKRDFGFDEIAKRIMMFDEVETIYLVSGTYDLAITVAGKTFKDVALFVAQKLSPMDGVTSTSTSFVLRKYKEKNIIIEDEETDVRGNASL
ncbi:Lrp/AsnC family transcriptional regulator [Candidatus Soleaferrea massiliensis]|uniref:Lrp/AsnC family transcriptional regulator n=1 Tax=Candidatus Soleaferrea massiliensis TaxID=1470354 RepID=UPI00058C498C|nr:Lrp/AsnC family transcriptional regulator [Candidatus Soleaferrea massiliensis]